MPKDSFAFSRFKYYSIDVRLSIRKKQRFPNKQTTIYQSLLLYRIYVSP